MIDVCFILEGTYPYVEGGVSTWVHQLITAIQDVRFGIVYISPHSDPTRRFKYEVPNHVLYFKEICLHDYDLSESRRRNPESKDYELLQQFYLSLASTRLASLRLAKNDFQLFGDFIRLFRGHDACFDIPTFFSSKEVFHLLQDFYWQHAEGLSFIDYFWTWRGTHLPLLQILRAEIPRAKIYHAVSTGYAGLLSAMAKQLYGGKFFLTEHGIYTHERMLEISQANWIYEREPTHFRVERDLSFFKKWWVEIFEKLSQIAYHHSDQIFTLFEGNKVREILSGADPAKIQIIPNGIDVRAFQSVPHQRKATPHIALIGRVVSIKDVKTFIQAARLVVNEIPEAKFYVAGPTTEEEDYYQECRRLTEALRLLDRVTFTGPVDVKQYYQFLDVVVLTSISEAQPYAILEANAVGVPVVATNVGACHELLEGREEIDQAIGRSGLITEVASPESTAQAIVKLLQDPALYEQCSVAGKVRSARYYDQDDLFSRYLNIYEKNF